MVSLNRIYHYNHLGNTVALTDDQGTVTDRVEYSPYGIITHREGTTDTPFLYSGLHGVMTDSNGLIHMRARYYNPTIRRFINADPIQFEGGTNWYLYANGNPILYVDPSGLDAYIDIGYSELENAKFTGQYHTFPIIRDSVTGEEFVTRAGPSGQFLGNVKPANALYQLHDYDNPSNTIHRQPIGIIKGDYDDVVVAAKNFAKITDENNIPYSPIGQGIWGYNSNSYTGTFIESLGFERPTPDLPSMGFSHGQPSNRLSYSQFQNTALKPPK